MKITCTKCNNILSHKDTMCMNCGLDMSAIKLELKNKEITSKKGKNKIIIFFEVLLLLIVVSIYLVLFVPRIIETFKEDPIEYNEDNSQIDDILDGIE